MKLITFAVFTTLSASVHAMSVPFMEQTALLFGWTEGHDQSSFIVDDENDRPHRPHRSGREGGTILDKLRDDKRFSKFVEILEEHRGLRDDLERTDTKVTVFAPTNDAIRKFKESMGHEGREWDKDRHRGGHRDREIDMDQLVRYHMIHEKFTRDELFDGMTLETELKLRELDNNRQRIRVFKMKGNVILNMYARVEEEMEAENGFVMAVDNVLVPPPDILETLYYLPTKFSTFISAVQKVDLDEDLEKHKAMTVFVPANAAWESLGLRNLVYLFSERGQEDLKKVIEFHMATELVYAEEILQKDKMQLETRLKSEKLELNIKKRHEKGGDDWEIFGRRGGEKDRCPNDYIISLNKGEATIVFTDAVAENGNIHLINSVLIPDSVKLPFEKSF